MYHAAALDPLSSNMACNVARILAHVRRREEALQAVSRELCWSNRGRGWIGYVQSLTGDYAQAAKGYRSDHSNTGGRTPTAQSVRVALLKADILEARAEGRPTETEQLQLAEKEIGTSFGFAAAYALAGDAEQAVRVLEHLHAERHPQLLWLTEPRFDLLRSDPGYRRLVQSMGLPIND